MEFITTQEDYAAMLRQAFAPVDFDRRLPEQVFRVKPARLEVVDWGRVWLKEAWPPLVSLARYYGDTEVAIAADPPHGHRWTEIGFPHLGAARIGVTEPVESYRTFVWQDDKYPILPEATTLAIGVQSGGFAMWGEIHGDFAIFALYNRSGRSADQAPFELPTFDLEEALRPEHGMITEFTEPMRRNYGRAAGAG